jgi:hypothetical protein
VYLKLSRTNLTLPLNHNPSYSNNILWDNIGYDRSNKFASSDTPDILRGKEESAPGPIFNTYWSSY